MEINTIADWDNVTANLDTADDETSYYAACYFDHGLIVENEIIVEVDKQQAFTLYERATNNGHIYAKVRLADFYSEGQGCEQDIDYAIKLYLECIKGKSDIAALNLATVYRDMSDLDESFKYYKIANELSESPVIQLAHCYYYGLGIDADKQKAFDIFKLIVDDSNSLNYFEYDIDNACYHIGLYYLNGEIVRKSIEQARYYFERANKDDNHSLANDILLMIGKSSQLNNSQLKDS